MARTRRTAEESRQALREAAVELFVGAGYGATSLEDIAGKVGITRQAALYHFRNKEELLRSVVEPYLCELDATLDKLEVGDPPTDTQRRDACTALVDVFADHRGLVSLLSRFTTDSTLAGLGPRLADLGSRIRVALAGPGAATDPAVRIRAHATHAALIGVVSARTDIPLDDPAERRTLVDAAMATLGA